MYLRVLLMIRLDGLELPYHGRAGEAIRVSGTCGNTGCWCSFLLRGVTISCSWNVHLV